MSEPVAATPWSTRFSVRGPSRPAILSREVLLVLGLSLGMSAIYSVVSTPFKPFPLLVFQKL